MSISSGTSRVAFHTTQWSLVLAASQRDPLASSPALEELCTKYWPALYGYVRRRGHSAEDARDLTQQFFLLLLQKDWLARADPQKGRFRSFILTLLKRFLCGEWDRAMAQKRGGSIQLESLSELAESQYLACGISSTTPEFDFERDWANALISNVFASLQQEYVAAGKSHLFEILSTYLQGEQEHRKHSEVAAELEMTEAAFRTAISRLRQRYRERIKDEVAATVADPKDVDSELRHLYRILARSH